jgi:hypothetical protein
VCTLLQKGWLSCIQEGKVFSSSYTIFWNLIDCVIVILLPYESKFLLTIQRTPMLILAITLQAALKIIESYMEGYRQDWKLSFEKDTVIRGGWYVNYLARSLALSHYLIIYTTIKGSSAVSLTLDWIMIFVMCFSLILWTFGTVTDNKEELLLLVLEKVTSHIFTRYVHETLYSNFYRIHLPWNIHGIHV